MIKSDFRKLISLSSELTLVNTINNDSAFTHFNEAGPNRNYTFTTGANNVTNETTAYSEPLYYITAGGTYYRFGFTIFVGSSDTAGTDEDYKLKNALNLQVNTSACVVQDLKIMAFREFQNNTEASVTIKEVGLYFISYTKRSSDNYVYDSYPCMVARKILTSPITLAAGETVQLQYVIDFNELEF